MKNRLKDIGEKYGTPLYVYDGDLISKKYNEILYSIPEDNLKVFYAMKANYNPHILKILKEKGSCIDAVSYGEVILAKKLGFSREKILFTANKIDDEEMDMVAREGVLFNIGSISRLKKYGKAYPRSNVCIRFNPNVVAGENRKVRTGGEATKFGIPLNKLEEVKNIAKKYDLKVVGLHEHTGSGIPESVQMLKGIKNILSIIKPENFPNLSFVDFGGGFKIPYGPNEKSPDYRGFGKKVSKLFSDACKGYRKKPEMYFEPGKFLVGEAGDLLVKATTLKSNGNKSFVGTDSGFPQLIRPMFYQAYHQIENLSNPKDKLKRYDIVGNICESGDCFGVDRDLPEVREGDILRIKTAGAYCYSMGGIYNLRPMPAEVVILNGKDFLSRRRQKYEEMIEKIIEETNFEIHKS